MKTRLAIMAVLCLTSLSASAQTPTPAPSATPTPVDYVASFNVTRASSLASRQAKTATRIGQRLLASDNMLLAQFRALYNDVWYNQDGLTPQQVCDALGANATRLFVIAGTMTNALYNIDPVGLGAMVGLPAGYAYTMNPDGTVTINYTAPAASPSPTPTH